MKFEPEQVDTLTIWGRECPVKVYADIFPGEEVTDAQQMAYTMFKEKLDNISVEAYAAFRDYCIKNFPDKINIEGFNIFAYIIPKSLYIKRMSNDKRVVGLFCKFRFDRENDLVAYIENEKVTQVGTQDIIL